mgnify:FL=1
MNKTNFIKLLNSYVFFLLTTSCILTIYSVFFPNSTFLFFQQTYIEVLGLTDSGGNGHITLLSYPLSLYLLNTFACFQYLRTQKIFYFDLLSIIWTTVLVSRIISILIKGDVMIDLYFFFGILTEFLIAPSLIFFRNKLIKES